MTPVPFNPEPLEALQVRYCKALDFLYDAAVIRDTGAIRPGECAANTFDFEDGLRLIVSRERMPDGEIVLHFSASFQDRCEIADGMQLLLSFMPHRRDQLWQKWLASVPGRFAELSGDRRKAMYIGTSDKKIPHWFIKDQA